MGNIWCERFGIVQAAVDYYSRLNYPKLVKCVTEKNRDPPEISIHVCRMKDVPEVGKIKMVENHFGVRQI